MKKHLFSFLTFGVVLFGGHAFSQRTCATHEYNLQLMKDNPAFAAMQQRIEKQTQDYIRNGGSRRMAESMATGTTVYTIPVVVHVVYKKSEQNISDAQIMSQIDVLNHDYQLTNSDASLVPDAFKSSRADFEIQFCLAKSDPQGNPTTGIVRKSTTKKSFNSNDNVKKSSKGGDDAWDATKYLNIWVCNLGFGLLGYAQFPGGPAATDGVVILYSAFGNTGKVNPPYDKGRSATHEIGHWLNLRHIWGDANCGNDFVDDTPTQQKSNYGCPSYPHITCSNGSNGDMFMNYMDYTDDACMFMFSIGQRDRSWAVLQPGGARYSITQSGKCNASQKTSSQYVSAATSNTIMGSTVKIYPQPANTFANIEFKNTWNGTVSVVVLNEMGQTVAMKQVNAESNMYKLDVSNFKSGLYFIRLVNNKEVVSQKIIVQH